MRATLICLLVLSSCTTFKSLFGPPVFEYCGKVDTLEVYNQQYSSLSCKEALDVTKAAYKILWQKGPGPLNESWRVEYIWGSIGVDDPYAHTDPDKQLVQVKEQESHSILHELGHAYMFENHSGGRNQHQKMCADDHWQQLERDFDVKPYCHWGYITVIKISLKLLNY